MEWIEGYPFLRRALQCMGVTHLIHYKTDPHLNGSSLHLHLHQNRINIQLMINNTSITNVEVKQLKVFCLMHYDRVIYQLSKLDLR